MQAHLLLIDDDPALLHAFTGMVSFHFPTVQITAVGSGRTALEELQKREYDIVICDLMMPVMDGAATLAEIRKDHPYLRMYLMTGHPKPEQAFKDTCATGFLKKPLNRAYFLDFMRRTIQAVAAGKRAMSKVVQANDHLSCSMKKQAAVERLLRAKAL